MFRLNSRAFILAIFFITGCGPILDTSKEFLNPSDEINLSTEQILNIPYPSIYMTLGEYKRSFIVLAYADNLPQSFSGVGQSNVPLLKWVSADNIMLTTSNGLLVKSVGITSNDLQIHQYIETDPFSLGLNSLNYNTTYPSTYKWKNGEHNYNAKSTFTNLGTEVIELALSTNDTFHIVEEVYVDAIKYKFTNDYWVDIKTGSIIKSIQVLYPSGPKVSIEIARPFGNYSHER